MTNYKEEQEMELEAMTSLFVEGEEFDRISDTEFTLKLKPYPQGEQENHVGVTMRIAYTAEYPDAAPDWELLDFIGMPEDKQGVVKEKVEETVEASLGMSMVYMMAEAVQEYLRDNNVKELSMHEEMLKRAGLDEPEEEEGEEEEEEEEEE